MNLHGVLLSIISNKGTSSLLLFWVSFKKGLGTQMKLSTAFHLQMDGQAERTVQTLKVMLRACVIYLKGSSGGNLLLIE